MRAGKTDNQARGGAGLFGVLSLVELRGRQVFRTIEGQLPIAAKVPGCLGQLIEFGIPETRKSMPLRKEHVGDIVHPRRIDARRAEQPLEREFDHLLRFADDIRPAVGVEQDVERAQPRLRTTQVVGSETLIPHYAATVQYGWPCTSRRTSFPVAMS